MIKQVLKRALFLFLAFAMTVSVVPVQVFASTVTDGGNAETEHEHYTVQFVNYDGTVLQTLTDLEPGQAVVYGGETPVKPEDGEYTYVFSGWSPEITAAYADTAYTAVFSPVEKDSSVYDTLLAAIDQILEQYLGTNVMDEETVYMTVAGFDNGTLLSAKADMDAWFEMSYTLTAEEQDALLAYSETFNYFDGAVLMYAAGAETLAATVTHAPVAGVTVGVSGATDNSMSNGAVTVTAKGYAGIMGIGASSKTATITITNSSDSTATVSFNWTATSVNQLTIDGTVYSGTSGSFSKVMDASAKITITITTASNSTVNKLVMSSFVIADPNVPSYVTFDYVPTLGGVTLGGSTVASGATQPVNRTTGAELVATPVNGSTFLGWIDAADGKIISTAASYTLIPATDMTVTAAFAKDGGTPWFGVGSGTKETFTVMILTSKTYYNVSTITHIYDNLNEAANAAASAGGYVVLMNSGTLSAGTYTIPSGVTLLIPFNSSNSCYTTDPEYTGISGTSPIYETPYSYRTLTMESGANIIVNGAISLSAKLKTTNASNDGGGAPSGPISFIDMHSNSNITVNNGGKLYAYGFIIGDGTVTANSGASVYEVFQVSDFRGGTCTSEMVENYKDKKVFPLNQYYVQNIEVPLTLHAGAKEYAYATLYMQNTQITSSVAFISDSSAMFVLSDGYVVKRYDGDTDRLIVDSYGTLSVSSIEIDMSVNLGLTSLGFDINTAEFVLPINGNITVNIHSGEINMAQDIALLPGAEINIAEGAKCVLGVGTEVYLYDAANWGGYCGAAGPKTVIPVKYAPSRKNNPSLVDQSAMPTEDAKILVNGTVDASQGYVYTTAGGAQIYSTGNGQIIMSTAPATETYQHIYTTPDTIGTDFVTIQVNSAWLMNADGSYVKTSDGSEGQHVYKYDSSSDKWVCLNADNHTPGDSVVIAPTCTEQGYTTYTCSVCGETYNGDYKDALDHTEGEAVKENEKAANCTDAGSYDSVVYCTVCEDELSRKTVTVDALGHDYEKVDTKAPTCTADGYTVYTCSVCGDTYNGDTVDAPGHSYNKNEVVYTWDEENWTCTATVNCSKCGEAGQLTETVTATYTIPEDKKPTCEEDGVRIYTATFENAAFDNQTNENGVEPATSHNFDDESKFDSENPRSEATCSAYATYWRMCANGCGARSNEKYTTGTILLGHSYELDGDDYEQGTLASPQTCEKAAVYYKACTVCHGDSNITYEVGEPLGHNYKSVDTAPTCTEQGYTTYTCQNKCECEKREYVDDYVDALGHELDEGSYAKKSDEPTCTEDGTLTKSCISCDYSETAPVAKLGHSYERNSSDYEMGTEVTAATCTDNAEHYKACTTCQENSTETYIVENTALGHETEPQFTAYKAPTCQAAGNEAYYTCSQCGDTFEDKACTIAISADDIVLDKVAHNYQQVGALVVTCTRAYFNKTCIYADCAEPNIEEDFKDYPGTLAPHQFTVEVEGTRNDATCTEDGSVTMKCQNCVATEAQTIPALGHIYTDEGGELSIVYNWSDDGKTCSATLTCANCGHEETVNATVSSAEKEAPTCTEKGETTYTATFTDAQYGRTFVTFEAQTKDVYDIAANGHSYAATADSYAWTLGENGWTCTATVKCANCKETVTDEAEVTSEQTKDPTCTEKGETTYTATFDEQYNGKDVFTTQTKTVDDIAAIGHKDDNTDHACDNGCGVYQGTHADVDKNHACDYGCSVSIGKHADSYTDDDHVCDYGCDVVLEDCENVSWNYSDNNNGTHDAACSICGEQMQNDADHKYDTTGTCACENTADASVTDGTNVTFYYTFVEAVKAAENGQTVTLLKDITLKEAINVSDKSITIKGNDNDAVTITTSIDDVFAVTKGATLTLGANLTVNSNTSILYANGGTITVDGATLNTNESSYALAFVDDDGVIEVKSGTLSASGADQVTVSVADGIVNISGGTVTNANSSAVHARENGVVNISGGRVDTTCKDPTFCAAYAYNGGVINVTGGEVDSETGIALVAISGGKVTVSGNATVNGVLAHESKTATATVSGGNFTGNVYAKDGASLTVSGGTFVNDVSDYCTPGHHTEDSDKNGIYDYKDCNSLTSKQENRVEPTCTDAGSCDDVKYCSVCGDERSRKLTPIGATGHTEVTDAAVAPTCTETGLTAGKHCSVCEKVIVAQERVDALNHAEVSHEAKAPTCTEIGWDAYVTCSRCDYTTYVEKPANDHKEGEAVVENNVDPICTATGHYDSVVYCTVCEAKLSSKTVFVAALSHDWGDVKFSWNTEHSECTATGICKNDNSHTVTQIVESENKVTTKATCTTKEVKTYTATFTAEWIPETERTQTDDVTGETAPNNHTKGCTYTDKGDIHTKKYECCGVTTDEGHTYTDGKCACNKVQTFTITWVNGDTTTTTTVNYGTVPEAPGKDKTGELEKASDIDYHYEFAGWGTVVAAVKNATYSAVYSAAEHDYTKNCKVCSVCNYDGDGNRSHKVGNPTCTEDAVCSVCHIVVNSAYGHKFTFNTELSGWTTDETGNHLYRFVANCTRENNCHETDEVTVIAVQQEAGYNAPTCTNAGSANYVATIPSNVEQSWAKDLLYIGSGTVSKVFDIDKLGHDLTETPAKDATCTEDGTEGYWTCSRCEKVFADAEAKTITSVEARKISLLGHDWKCTADANDGDTLECSRCTKTTTEDISDAHTWVYENEKPATCTEPGEHAGSKCSVCGKEIDKGEIPALGHRYGDPTYAWTQNGSTWSCTATRICERYGCSEEETDHTQTVAATVSSKITEESTCIVMGKTTYTATFDVDWAKAQVKTEQDVALAEHTPDEGIITKSPFYNQKGERTYYCTACEAVVKTEPVDATGVINISVLGDSITAFENYSNGTAANTTNTTLSGGKVWFPMTGREYDSEGNPIAAGTGEITEAKHIWIYKAAEKLGANVLVNNSWSGSAVHFWQYGADAMYKDRVVQLHDNTGDNSGQEPDIIIVYMGTNDFKYTEKVNGTYAQLEDGTYYQSVLGSYETVVFDSLITKAEDGTFTYAEPKNAMEAYAISFHKMKQRYPNSEIYVMTLLPFRAGIHQPNDFNDDLIQMAKYFGLQVIDIEDTGIESDETNFKYLMEDWLHPNLKGMEVLANAVESVVRKTSKLFRDSADNYVDVTYVLDGVTAMEGTKRIAEKEKAFDASLKLKDMSLTMQVTVSHNGEDITEKCVTVADDPNTKLGGKIVNINIENVTGDIEITAKAHKHDYTSVVTDPACTAAGYTTYTCGCGDIYVANEVGSLGHSYTAISDKLAQKATCTENAKYYAKCERCKDVHTTETFEKENTKLGHSYTNKDSNKQASPATCTEPAKNYVQCDRCDAVSNVNFVSVGEALGHSFDEAKYTWNYDAAKTKWICTATRTCRNDTTHIETATATVASEIKTPATCTAKGWTTYTATFSENWATTQTKDVDDIAALNHAYGATTYEWSDGNTKCTAKRVCTRDGSHVDTVEVEVTSRTTDATCTSDGKTTYTANFTAEWATRQTKEEKIPSKGHTEVVDAAKDPTCTATGLTEGKRCSVCSKTLVAQTVVAALGHDYKAVTTLPTCTEDGYTTYTCSRCNNSYTDNKTFATGHSWTVEYNFAADGSACTATHICGNDAKHNVTVEATISSAVKTAATCEGKGTTTYTATFSENWAEPQTKDVDDIAAINHAWSVSYEWTDDGKSCTATRTCANDAKHNVTAKATISSAVKTAATCEGKGTTTYTATFSENWAEPQTKDVDDIAAINHAWSVSYEWTDDGKSCTATRACGNDAEHNVTAKAKIASEVKTAATCEGKGTTTYTATFDADWATEQTKDVDDIAAINHAWSVSYEWTDDGKTCTATRACANDASHDETATATISSEQTKDPTCTEMGETTYKAAFEDEWAEAQTKTVVDIAATGHSYEVVVTAPTCEKMGYTTHTCSACTENTPNHSYRDSWTSQIGHNYSATVTKPTCTEKGYTTYTCANANCEKPTYVDNYVDAAGHKAAAPVEENREEATCLNDGKYDSVVYCSVCKTYEISRETKTLGALGHNYTAVVTAPTCLEGGYTTHTCTRCDEATQGHSYTDSETDALNHNYEAKVTAPTCTEGGYTTHTCTRCDESTEGHSYKDAEIEALGHDIVIDNAVDPDCTTTGLTEGSHCSRCDDMTVKQETVPALKHDVREYDYVAPTCTDTGLSGGSYCDRCGVKFSAQKVLPATGHVELTYHEAVPHTCTEDGTVAYYECICGSYFAKKNASNIGTDVITDLVDKAPGHTEGTPVTENDVKPTCTAGGSYDTVVYCTACSGELSRATTTVDALGHKEGTPVTENDVKPTCTEGGSYDTVVYCTVCDGELSRETTTVDALGHTETTISAVDPKCEVAGATKGTKCSVCDEVLVEPEEIPALEHDWGTGRITTEPTCTEAGVRTFTCINCRNTKEAEEPEKGHDLEYYEAKKPTNYSVGWTAYEACKVEDCGYSTFDKSIIPSFGEPSIKDFDTFVENLALLEEITAAYIKENPGKDPLLLMIKYIRTGVDRYNSGSWNIMAGYEDADFAAYVKECEENYNLALEDGQEVCIVTGLKNLRNFRLPNGDLADIGHMFGTLDISYHNKGSENHADVAGWAGDLVDLLQLADWYKEDGTIEELVTVIGEKYFLTNANEGIPEEYDIGSFSQTDYFGDLDGFYVMQQLYATEYKTGTLTDIITSYMTADLTDEYRAEFFLKNRLGGVSTRTAIRDAVYDEYMGNSVITTLEGTREFNAEDLSNLRKATCYAFADYICKLAGDYVEFTNNTYFTVFQSTFSTLAPGITQEIKLATTADNKQIKYYIATGDVTSEYVNVYANYHNNDPAGGWEMQRVLDQANAAQNKYGDPESDQYIENYNVIASINGAGYDMSTGEPGGVLMMGGVEYHAPNGAGFFGILKDGSAVIGTDADYYAYKEQGILSEAIAQFGTTLVVDGKIAITANSDYYNDRASRTAIGITKTGKVVFMVLDGRQEPVSCGGSMIEIAHIMLEAGCYYAVNLDGGGSTTYVAKPEGEDALRVVSSPSDGYARSVSTSLIMVSTAPSSTAFDHAVITAESQYLTVGASSQLTAAGVSPMGNAVDVPEGTVWTVDNGAIGSIDENGVFTAKANGDVEVRLMLDGEIVGITEMHVVIPDTVYFTKENINAIYGEPAVLPAVALYDSKPVATVEGDIGFILSNTAAGEIDGSTFIASEASGLKKVSVTAYLTADESVRSSKALNVAIYSPDELSFDFDNATGGDRMLAWNREISNATTTDGITYMVENLNEDMVTSYTFAIDMTQIPIPDQLSELVYMLPGADVEGANSAWSFLLQLAERISVLSNVTPVLRFDKNFEIDYSELEIVCEYFQLSEEQGVVYDPEANTLTLNLYWKDQTQAIDPDTANPMCIVSGVKLTPKDDAAWDSKSRLNAVHSGEISYDIYMRANALYSFSQKEENQKAFGVYPFVNPDIPSETGGHFGSVYKEFTDSYTLINSLKSGWVNEDGGWAYYENGERYLGVKKVDKFYYDFGEEGINVGQTPYTGLFEEGGNTYYAKFGVLVTNGWYLIDEAMYHINAKGHVHTPVVSDPVTCTKGGYRSYKCTTCNVSRQLGNYVMPNGHVWDENYVCTKCGTVGKNIEDAICRFGTITNPWTSSSTPKYSFTSAGVRPTTHVTFDGKTALTMSSGASLNDDGTMRDIYVTYSDNKNIGKAYVDLTGKGDYYGTVRLEFIIIPARVTTLKASEVGMTSVTLSWTAAPGADYYRLFSKNISNGALKEIATNIVGTSYKVTGLTPNKEYQYVIYSYAYDDDDPTVKYNSSVSDTLSVVPTISTEAVISDCQVYVGDYRVTDIREDGSIYLFLPTNADLKALDFKFEVDSSEAGNNVIVSGNKSSAEVKSANGYRGVIDLTSVAAANADGSYTIGVSVGQYSPVTVTVMQGNNIPDLFLTSDDAAQGRAYVDADKSNETTAQMLLTAADGTVIYNGALTQLKARGNSTFSYYPKKSYQIKLDTKTDLLGTGENVKTWVLLAGYGDATQMHDKFFKDLAEEMNMPYTASSDWVNVWYDGEYRGIYLLSEKNSVGGTSVDITDLEEVYEELNPDYGDDMSIADGVNKYGQMYKYATGLVDPADATALEGGYLIELNLYEIDEASGFMTKKGHALNVKSPEYASNAAMIYISEYFQEFEDAVYATDENGNYTGFNEETGKYFYEYVDLDSLVQVFLIQELGLNSDGFVSSLYFYKDAGDIMYAGPVWDQEMVFGTGWTQSIASDRTFYNYLAEALVRIPAFTDRVKEYYSETFAPLVKASIANGGAIDQYYTALAENADMNYILWPLVKIGKPDTAGHLWAEGTTYGNVVDAMRVWISQRLQILDEKYSYSEVRGDANHDGLVNSDDAVLILRDLADYELDFYCDECADYNGDGVANSDDAVAILRMLAGY